MDFKVSQLQYLLDVGTINQDMFDQVKNSLIGETKREIGYRKKSDEESLSLTGCNDASHPPGWPSHAANPLYASRKKLP